MKKRAVTAIFIVLGLSVLMGGCDPAQRQETTMLKPSPASTSSSSQAQTTPTPSPAASPERSVNPLREPTFKELEDAIPAELLDLERCAPVDEVTFTPRTGVAPLTVTFNGRKSTAPCGKIVKWEWNFGDGTTGSGSRVNHTYTVSGQYVVTLNITDNKGKFNLTPLDHIVIVTSATPAKTRSRAVPGEALTGVNAAA
jgi:PKD repeat protein